MTQSVVNEQQAQLQTIEFLTQHVSPQSAPLCGNSIGTDRRFLIQYMPQLADYFHYRNIDVSTCKILAQHWAPQLAPFPKKNCHTALSDILESIEELRYYKKYLMRV